MNANKFMPDLQSTHRKYDCTIIDKDTFSQYFAPPMARWFYISPNCIPATLAISESCKGYPSFHLLVPGVTSSRVISREEEYVQSRQLEGCRRSHVAMPEGSSILAVLRELWLPDPWICAGVKVKC
ncbi:hypothetical protein AVEN_165640-1 [Araneus ventricosus]|uniref:Uncharacterized protein n=1 Tax=Araneus ventricosus TaxID=182803 RepID=A0A4Y2PIP8_ARAVE|nr:hypothetical protein AVEN_165640-1 [Araneus ventricosus]